MFGPAGLSSCKGRLEMDAGFALGIFFAREKELLLWVNFLGILSTPLKDSPFNLVRLALIAGKRVLQRGGDAVLEIARDWREHERFIIKVIA